MAAGRTAWPSVWAIRIALLLVLFAQLVLSVPDKSPTIDEPNHLARGYAYLKTGDLRLSRDEGHPPLFNLLCALPLLTIEGLELPVHLYSWQTGFRNAFAIEFFFGGQVPLALAVFLGRFPVMLATMCLAALAARWAGELYGSWGSVMALALCAFDPNLIAHGRLATTDMGITFFAFATLYVFWRYLRRPAWPGLVLSGVFLGVAQGTKFSALVLFPLLGLLGLMEALAPRGSLGRTRVRSLATLAGVMVLLLALAGLTVWAIYGFQVGRPEGWAIGVPAPVYIEGLEKTVAHAADFGHPSFLMGERSNRGWWYYFPVAFALKTPLPSLVALLGALVSLAWRRMRRSEAPLLLVPAIYMGASMGSVLNIGYRHLLPILPFLWVYVGRLAPILDAWAGSRTARARALACVAVVGLGSWLACGTMRVAPHYLAYFNALAGGPDGGWRFLVDSNLDWGQDLPALQAYLVRHSDGADEREPEPVHLSWFGCTYPHLYGLDLSYRLLPSHFSYPYPGDAANSPYNPLFPAPGLYAIGATNLNGVGLAAGDVFERFRSEKPLARIGHSIHIYRVGSYAQESNPTCISGLRFKDLSAETEALSLGRGPGAVKWFDHRQSFILPAAGDPTYVLNGLPLGFDGEWQDAFQARAEISHVQADGEQTPSGRSLPGAVVYRLDRASADGLRQAILSRVETLPMSWSPSTVLGPDADLRPLAGPVSFEHGLELLGYLLPTGDTLRPGEVLELLTVWQSAAEMPPAAFDLRVFVHLLDDQSRVWGGEDRLDLHPPTWEAGDLLIQRHRVPLAANAQAGIYQVEMGAYATITFERLAVQVDGVPVGDRLLLQPIQVQ